MSTTLTTAVGERDHVQGRPDALLTLVEYGDYECPSCGQAYWIVKAVQHHLGAALRFVFRNFPLHELHPHALMAAEAAEAAAVQGKFWQMHDLLFENQQRLGRGQLLQHAQAALLDTQRWTQDITRHAFAERVQQDIDSGLQSGVQGTPTFFINGRRHDASYDERTLVHALEAVLEERRHGVRPALLP